MLEVAAPLQESGLRLACRCSCSVRTVRVQRLQGPLREAKMRETQHSGHERKTGHSGLDVRQERLRLIREVSEIPQKRGAGRKSFSLGALSLHRGSDI